MARGVTARQSTSPRLAVSPPPGLALSPSRPLPLLELALVTLAFGLRLSGLGWRSLWFDEGYSAWLVRADLPLLLAAMAEDVHPPLYYLVMRLWLAIAGRGDEFTLRFLS